MQNSHKKTSCVLLRDDKPIGKQGELPAAYTLFPPFFLRYSRVCVREARGRRLCHRLYNVTVLWAKVINHADRSRNIKSLQTPTPSDDSGA